MILFSPLLPGLLMLVLSALDLLLLLLIVRCAANRWPRPWLRAVARLGEPVLNPLLDRCAAVATRCAARPLGDRGRVVLLAVALVLGRSVLVLLLNGLAA